MCSEAQESLIRAMELPPDVAAVFVLILARVFTGDGVG